LKKISVGITGLGSYVPERVVTNDDISKLVETSDDWIVTRTGIRERRVADEKVATSDLAVKAAELALKDAGIDADELDLIIVATATPDHAFPSTAALVQKNLGASKAAAFDLSVGCSGFIYGMVTGANFISSGMYKKVLVIGAETLSKIVDWTDRNTCVLFGDGAGACVLESCDESFGILASELGSDGLNGDVLILPAGGSRYPATAETVEKKLHTIKMDGKEVFKFAVRVMEKSSMRVLEEAGLTQDQLDFLIPHQANMRIIDAAMKKLQLGREKTHINLDKYGNMSAASIPVSLDEALREGKIKEGDVVLLIAFGAGLSWASIVMRWNRRDRDV
jgi:3-oxoacyl-[acyl-carrier-protein] synthase-3